MVTVDKSAVLKIIFDSVGKPATEIYHRVRDLPAAEIWNPASKLPEIEKEEREEDTWAQISVPVLAIVRDGTYQIVRRIEETALEPGGYAWTGWVREPDDGCAEDVVWWTELPPGPGAGG